MAPKRGNGGSPGQPLSQKFIDDSDASSEEAGSDFGGGKKGKKPPAKKAKESKKEESREDESGEEQGGTLKNAEGDVFVELSKNKRVTVRKYRNAVLIDVRETYEKDGVAGLPGKKGLSLNLEQWTALKDSFGAIDAAIAALK